jgi:predicted permease
VFGIHGAALLDVVVTSALPAAQNLYTYASRYRVGEGLARDSILLSTVLSVPVLVVIAALLGTVVGCLRVRCGWSRSSPRVRQPLPSCPRP